jgi:hypothetical protein
VKYPPKTEEFLQPIEAETFAEMLEKYRNISPNER